MMARNLDLLRGGNRYIKTAAYGHFGRDDLDVFTWEKVLHYSLLSPSLCLSACLSFKVAILRIVCNQ